MSGSVEAFLALLSLNGPPVARVPFGWVSSEMASTKADICEWSAAVSERAAFWAVPNWVRRSASPSARRATWSVGSRFVGPGRVGAEVGRFVGAVGIRDKGTVVSDEDVEACDRSDGGMVCTEFVDVLGLFTLWTVCNVAAYGAGGIPTDGGAAVVVPAAPSLAAVWPGALLARRSAFVVGDLGGCDMRVSRLARGADADESDRGSVLLCR